MPLISGILFWIRKERHTLQIFLMKKYGAKRKNIAFRGENVPGNL